MAPRGRNRRINFAWVFDGWGHRVDAGKNREVEGKEYVGGGEIVFFARRWFIFRN